MDGLVQVYMQKTSGCVASHFEAFGKSHHSMSSLSGRKLFITFTAVIVPPSTKRTRGFLELNHTRSETSSFPSSGMAGSSSRATGVDPNMVKLCEFCKSFDFHVLGIKMVNHEGQVKLRNERVERKSREIKEIMEVRGCVICAELAESIKRTGLSCGRAQFLIDSLPGTQWAFKDEVDARGERGFLERFMVELHPQNENQKMIPLIQFQKCSNPPLDHRFWHYDGLKEVYREIISRGNLSKEDQRKRQMSVDRSRYLEGRLRPGQLDYILFSNWISRCLRTHRESCNLCDGLNSSPKHVKPPPEWLRLIDVRTRRLVRKDLVQKPPYVALSYVWGEDKLGKRRKMPKLGNSEGEYVSEDSELSRKRVLATIDDAMTVVRELGKQYLWVDCLCIKQDDEEEQENFMNAMDSIYGCALFTIVAAFGDSAQSGLPGVRGPRRKQKVLNLGNGISLLQTLDPKETREGYEDYRYLGGSTWITRGWTLQEKTFSRRCLIFTEDQVYWECQGGTWCEDSFWEMNFHYLVRYCFQDPMLRIALHTVKDSETLGQKYRLFVKEYSQRELTKNSDGLRAFQGCLNALELGPKKWKFLCGLPLFNLDCALTWNADCVALRPRNRRGSSSKENEEVTKEGEERDIIWTFPSWTWVGWVGKVSDTVYRGYDLNIYYYDAVSKKLVEANRRSLYFRGCLEIQISKEGDQKDVHFDDIAVQEALSKESTTLKILFFRSSAKKFDVQVVRIEQNYTKLRVLHGCFNVSRDFDFLIGERATHVECELVVIGIAPNDGYGYVYKDERDIVHGRKREAPYVKVIVLVCYERNGILYRMGLVGVSAELWMEQNPVWKLICLG